MQSSIREVTDIDADSGRIFMRFSPPLDHSRPLLGRRLDIPPLPPREEEKTSLRGLILGLHGHATPPSCDMIYADRFHMPVVSGRHTHTHRLRTCLITFLAV